MRILLTTHGMDHDELALRFGAQVACYAEKAMVLMVIDDADDTPRAEAILGQVRALLNGLPNLATRVRVGSAAHEIVREAREEAYDLIVIGQRQENNWLGRWRSTPTSIRVVEHAPCAVVVAKGKVSSIQKILLCDSGAQGPLSDLGPVAPGNSETGPSLLTRFTAQLAGMLCGEEEITVLHVMSQISAGPGVKGKQLRADALELIEDHSPEGELLLQDVQVLVQPGVRAQAKVRHGLVLDEILDEARGGDYDLLVIGAHRHEGWQHLLLDDLARKIINQADRPVLVVR
jgi:nucleotide-binding universal stress UspA family protein